MNKVLIAYRTATNTTKEAAEVIKEALTESQIDADVLDVREVQSITEYDSVVIGAPINGFRWLPDAVTFVKNFEKDLKNVPTSVYMMSYLYKAGSSKISLKMAKALDDATKSISPLMVGYFGGKTESMMPGIMRFMFGVKKDAPLDTRDTDEIKRWAADLSGKLKNIN